MLLMWLKEYRTREKSTVFPQGTSNSTHSTNSFSFSLHITHVHLIMKFWLNDQEADPGKGTRGDGSLVEPSGGCLGSLKCGRATLSFFPGFLSVTIAASHKTAIYWMPGTFYTLSYSHNNYVKYVLFLFINKETEAQRKATCPRSQNW